MLILKKWFLVIVTLGVLGFLGAEAFLWGYHRQPDAPETLFVFQNDLAGVRPRVDYGVNGRMMRTLDWTENEGGSPGGTEKDAARILVVGGASSDLFLHNAEDTWWGLMGRNLQEGMGLKVEVASYGGGGDHILNGAKWCEENLEELDVDLLIVSYGMGDVMQGGSAYHYDPDKFFRMLTDGRARWKQVLSSYSQIYRYLSLQKKKKIIDERRRTMEEPNYLASLLKSRRDAYATLPYVQEVRRQIGHDPVLEYLDGIDHFIAMSRAMEVPLLVLGEAVLHHEILGPDEIDLLRYPVRAGASYRDFVRPDPAWVEEEVLRFFEAGKARCDEEGVPFFPLNRKVPKTAKYFIDDSVLTMEGCVKVAELISPLVERMLREGFEARAAE